MIEHEVRSFPHPMYMRPLVNRNPAQRQTRRLEAGVVVGVVVLAVIGFRRRRSRQTHTTLR